MNGTSCSATSAARRRSSRSRGSRTGGRAFRCGACRRRSAISTSRSDALLAPVKTPRVAVRGAQPKTLIVDTLIPDTIERFPVGRPSRHAAGRPGRRRDRARAQFARLHQHALAGGDLVSARCSKSRPDWAGLIALHHGSLDQEVARVGRARPQERPVEGGGLHVEPRSRRRFPARRARVPDRLAERRRAPDAARRALGPRAGPGVARDDRADARARTRRSGGGALGRRGTAHRRPRDAATSRSTCSSSIW